MWRADDSDLDRAIDEVARQMTAGEPDASLRARVVERLSERGGVRRRVWAVWVWAVAPAAATALIIAALIVARDRRSHTIVTPSATMIAAQRTVSPIGQLVADAFHSRASVPDAQETRAALRPLAIAASKGRGAAAPPPASALDALAPARLTVTSLRLNEIDPAVSIQLPELDPIAPITVEPIGAPQGDRP